MSEPRSGVRAEPGTTADGHAIGGSSRYEGFSRVSRLLNHSRGGAATPREGTGKDRGGRSQGGRRSRLRDGVRAWRGCPDAPVRRPQCRFLGPGSFPPAARLLYPIQAVSCSGRLSSGVFLPVAEPGPGSLRKPRWWRRRASAGCPRLGVCYFYALPRSRPWFTH
jgi:hypothetical protein